MQKTIITKDKDLVVWLSTIGSVCSIDFETTGLHYLSMEPVGFSMYDGERATYVDLERSNESERLLQTLGKHLPQSMWAMHNAKFDCNCCFKFCGTVPASIFDTYTAALILDENRDSYKLKVLAQADLGVPSSQIQMYLDVADQVGSDKWYEYCFNDSIWAFALYQLYAPKLKEQGLDYLFYKIEMPFVPVLAYMERTGVLVDKAKLLELQNRVGSKILEVEDKMLELCGKEPVIQFTLYDMPERHCPINFNSPTQVKNIWKEFGLEVPKDRKKKESLDKKLIAPLIGKHPFVDLYLEYKMLQKLQTSYLVKTWDFIDEDGRMRPSFGMTKTGRLTCSRPPLQTCPRVSDPELNYRSVIKAKEGCSLLAPDYAGQELRLLGVVTEDSVIMEAFLGNLDLHLLTANNCFNLGLSKKQLTEGTPEFEEAKKKYAEQRYKAKNGANFPIIYGTTAYGVSWRQGVSVEEAQRWIDSFFHLYPNVQRAMEETRTELERVGWVTTLFGRKRRFPDYRRSSKYEKESMLRQAFNFKIQGSAADQVKIAMAKIYQAGVSIILQVHDEVVCEVDSDKAEQVGKQVQEIMENAVSFCIPFKVDYKIARSYGLLK